MVEDAKDVATPEEEDFIVLRLELIESKKKMDKYGISMKVGDGDKEMDIGVGTLYILRSLTDTHRVGITLGGGEQKE